MTNVPTFRLCLVLSLALLPTGLAAQQPAEPVQPEAPFAEELTVTEVLLDVLVTDPKGNVIVGLGPEDFVVEEDGEPVSLTSATFYSNRPLLEPAALATGEGGGEIDPATRKRYFILLLEEQQRKSPVNPGLIQRQLQAARDTREWLAGGLLLDDYVAVVSYDVRLKVHQDFTRDRAKLERAMTAAAAGEDPGANWPSRIQPEEEGAPSLRAHLPSGRALGEESETIYDALRLLAEAAGHFVGRKNLILYSTGFGEINEFGQYQPDPRYFPPMARALNDNNVAVYSVDLTPLGFDHVQAGALNHIATATGGEYYFNFTRFTTPLKKLADQTSGYYLLSYRSPHPKGESGYQKVEVKTVNPEFRVKAREGYRYGGGAGG